MILPIQEELLRRIQEMDGENQELMVEVSRLKEVRFSKPSFTRAIIKVLRRVRIWPPSHRSRPKLNPDGF